MGEMADYYLDLAFDDEDLTCYYASRMRSAKRLSGPGKCPICDGETTLKDGKFGKFYGCNNFPKCKGSRNFE